MKMKHWIWILAMIIVLIILSAGLFKKSNHDQTLIHSIAEEDECDWFLGKGKEPNLWETRWAMQRYFHCTLNIFKKEDQNCYKEIHDQISSCLEARHQTLSEREIQRGITGGIMEEFCADINKACAEVAAYDKKNDPPKNEEEKKALEITEKLCRDSLEKACQSLKSK